MDTNEMSCYKILTKNLNSSDRKVRVVAATVLNDTSLFQMFCTAVAQKKLLNKKAKRLVDATTG